MTALPASLSHVEMSFTFPRYPARLPYNIQRPFFSNRLSFGLLLCKCHPTSDVTLKMSPRYPFH